MPTPTFSALYDDFTTRLLPAEMSDATDMRFRALAQAVTIARGESITLPRTDGQLVYVGSGATKLVVAASSDREQIIAFHFAGDLVCVPKHSQQDSSLCALSDSELLVFPEDEFLDLARVTPEVMSNVYDRAMTALRRCREKTVALGRKNASEKLADFLLSMAVRIGAEQDGEIVINLPMSRRDIGDSMGLTIETVSRQITDFRTQGLIETYGRSTIRLRNLDELENRAGNRRLAA